MVPLVDDEDPARPGRARRHDAPPDRRASDGAGDETTGDRCPQCDHEVGDAWLVCAFCGQQLAAPAELAEGARLGDGRYQVLDVLGRGGFGITYDVGDRRLQRRVAVKELFPESAVRHGSLVLTPPEGRAGFRAARERFMREARVLARFTHPGIVRVYEVFEEHGTAYLVMELLEGRTLIDLLRDRGRAFPEDVVLDVAGSGGRRAAAGARRRGAAPRHQPVEHHADQPRPDRADRLRPRPGLRPGAEHRHDPGGDARVRTPRAVPGPGPLRARHRRLRVGRHRVPPSHRQGAAQRGRARRRGRDRRTPRPQPGDLQAGERRHPRRPRAGAQPPSPRTSMPSWPGSASPVSRRVPVRGWPTWSQRRPSTPFPGGPRKPPTRHPGQEARPRWPAWRGWPGAPPGSMGRPMWLAGLELRSTGRPMWLAGLVPSVMGRPMWSGGRGAELMVEQTTPTAMASITTARGVLAGSTSSTTRATIPSRPVM